MSAKISLQQKMNEVVKTLPDVAGYKMGYINKLKVGDLTAIDDAREYYSGRGAKYNSSIRHGGNTTVMTEKELNKAYKPIAERIKLLKKIAIEAKKFAKKCEDFKFVCQIAAEHIKVVGWGNRQNFPKNTDWTGREDFANDTHLSHYSGCGVYRTGWKNGKMTCTLYGGFHGSKGYDCIPENVWIDAVMIEMKKYSDHIVKMDGSGTQFFFRNFEDADLVTNATEVYYVPSYRGGLHLNIQPATVEVLTPKQISND